MLIMPRKRTLSKSENLAISQKTASRPDVTKKPHIDK